MSFDHPPVIPQTVEQAQQRDHLAGLPAVPLDDPRAELERLRQAIRNHRTAVQGAPIKPNNKEQSDAVLDRMGADLELWSHIGETA